MKWKISSNFLVLVCLALIGGRASVAAVRAHGGQLARIHLASFEVSPGELLQLAIEIPMYDRPLSLQIHNHAPQASVTAGMQSAMPVYVTEIADNDNFDLDPSAGRIERTIATGDDWQPGKYRVTLSKKGEAAVYTQASFLLSTANILDFLKSRLQHFRDRVATDAKRLQRTNPERESTIILYSPANCAITAAQPGFLWSGVSNTEMYLLSIRHEGKVVFKAESPDTAFVLPTDALAKMTPGLEYFWEVEAKRGFRAPIISERSAGFTVLPREPAERIARVDRSLSDKSLAAPIRIALYEENRLFESADSVVAYDLLLGGLIARIDTTERIQVSRIPGSIRTMRDTLVVIAEQEKDSLKKGNLYWKVAHLESVLGEYQAALQHLHLTAQLFIEDNRIELYQQIVGEIESLFDAMMIVHGILRP